MNGKPKSYGAMCKAVQYCTHPELDATDIALLGCLANYADAQTGRNSKPGLAALMQVSRLKKRATEYRMENLEDLRLIECTYQAHGRGHASIYRICLENPAFPDKSPNSREWFIENPPDDGGPENVQHGVHVLDEKRATDTPKTCNENPKTCNEGPENVQPRGAPHPKPIQPPSSPHPMAGGPEFSLVEWQANLPGPMNTEAMGGHEKKVRAFVESKGAVLARGYVVAWLERRDIKGLRDLWGAFLREAEMHAKEAFENTPEGRAAEQRRKNAMVEAAAKRIEQNAREQLEKSDQEQEESFEEVMRKLEE